MMWSPLTSRRHFLPFQEHFFTVLLAVAVFSINELLRAEQDLSLYILLYSAFYASLSSTLRYAARHASLNGCRHNLRPTCTAISTLNHFASHRHTIVMALSTSVPL